MNTDLDIPAAVCLNLFEAMLRIRMVEEAVADRYVEQEMRCPVHLSIGQEGAAVGACSALESSDVIVSNHRSHGHYLAKGGDLDAMLAELYGRETGCCGGRGGSMHLFDNDAGIIASVPIVGSTIPVAVGAALSFDRDPDSRVSIAFLGDGATEEGVFHESLNFASLQKLPVIFFVENNLYSVYTPLASRQPDRPLEDYGRAHGVPGFHVDGNDVVEVYKLTRTLIGEARRGGGPSLVVADTYRWREHCGPSFDNDLGYRTASEFEYWRELCPIERGRNLLSQQGLLNVQLEQEMIRKINAEIDHSFEKAKAAPFPGADTVALNVYA